MLATNYGKGIRSSSLEQQKEAIKWLEAAAMAEHPDAKGFLGMLKALPEN